MFGFLRHQWSVANLRLEKLHDRLSLSALSKTKAKSKSKIRFRNAALFPMHVHANYKTSKYGPFTYA